MKTRKFGGLAALALAIIGVVALAQPGQTQERKADHAEHNEMMQACAKACADCQRACDMCATHCAHLLAAGEKEHLAAMTNCQDCATCCAACAQICARGGPHSALMADCCATSCDQCAKACEAFPDDKELKTCAQECRKCEKACRTMAKHAASR